LQLTGGRRARPPMRPRLRLGRGGDVQWGTRGL